MDDLKHCSSCGQVIVPPASKLHLSPQQRRIYEAVRERGRTTKELRALLYGHYPVPPVGKTIHVVISQLNRRLRPLGVKLLNPQGHYHIIEVQPNADSVCKRPQHSDA